MPGHQQTVGIEVETWDPKIVPPVKEFEKWISDNWKKWHIEKKEYFVTCKHLFTFHFSPNIISSVGGKKYDWGEGLVCSEDAFRRS